jgi:hypothetical protein
VARLAKPPRVIIFADKDGKEPFTEWLYGLKDVMGRKRSLFVLHTPRAGQLWRL